MTWITACIPGSMELSGIMFSAIQAGSVSCAKSTALLLRSARICTQMAYTAGSMRERLTRTCADDTGSIISSIMGLRSSSDRIFSIQSDHLVRSTEWYLRGYYSAAALIYSTNLWQTVCHGTK